MYLNLSFSMIYVKNNNYYNHSHYRVNPNLYIHSTKLTL